MPCVTEGFEDKTNFIFICNCAYRLAYSTSRTPGRDVATYAELVEANPNDRQGVKRISFVI